MKRLALVLMLFCSCHSNNNPVSPETPSTIVGKWDFTLIAGWLGFPTGIVDLRERDGIVTGTVYFIGKIEDLQGTLTLDRNITLCTSDPLGFNFNGSLNDSLNTMQGMTIMHNAEGLLWFIPTTMHKR